MTILKYFRDLAEACTVIAQPESSGSPSSAYGRAEAGKHLKRKMRSPLRSPAVSLGMTVCPSSTRSCPGTGRFVLCEFSMIWQRLYPARRHWFRKDTSTDRRSFRQCRDNPGTVVGDILSQIHADHGHGKAHAEPDEECVRKV